MRRIDLFCKLVGPLTISLVATASTEVAIYTTLGMNAASVAIEYCFIEQVGTSPQPTSLRRESAANGLQGVQTGEWSRAPNCRPR